MKHVRKKLHKLSLLNINKYLTQSFFLKHDYYDARDCMFIK